MENRISKTESASIRSRKLKADRPRKAADSFHRDPASCVHESAVSGARLLRLTRLRGCVGLLQFAFGDDAIALRAQLHECLRLGI